MDENQDESAWVTGHGYLKDTTKNKTVLWNENVFGRAKMQKKIG